MDNSQQKFQTNPPPEEQSDKDLLRSICITSESRRSSRASTHSIYTDVEEFTVSLPIIQINSKARDYDSDASEYESEDEDNKSNISETVEISMTPEEEASGNMSNAITPDSIENTKSKEIDVFRKIADDTLKELEEAFELFDLNGDGLITHADLKRTFQSLGQEVTDDNITKMLAEGSKPLDFEGFVKMVGGRTVQMDSEDVLFDALSKWDYKKTGLIPVSRLRQDLMSWGDRFTEPEVEWALEEAATITKRGVTMIEYRDFCQFLCGMRKKDP